MNDLADEIKALNNASNDVLRTAISIVALSLFCAMLFILCIISRPQYNWALGLVLCCITFFCIKEIFIPDLKAKQQNLISLLEKSKNGQAEKNKEETKKDEK